MWSGVAVGNRHHDNNIVHPCKGASCACFVPQGLLIRYDDLTNDYLNSYEVARIDTALATMIEQYLLINLKNCKANLNNDIEIVFIFM